MPVSAVFILGSEGYTHPLGCTSAYSLGLPCVKCMFSQLSALAYVETGSVLDGVGGCVCVGVDEHTSM